jgi:hypothetical protein
MPNLDLSGVALKGFVGILGVRFSLCISGVSSAEILPGTQNKSRHNAG